MKVLEAIANVFRVPDLRKRILFTLAMLAVYRIGGHIPTPGINTPELRRLFAQAACTAMGMTLAQIDVIELNEAFAAQGLAVLRDLGLADDDARVNPNGGAIALGHPLGMSGARLVTTAINQLHRIRGRYALCTMCIGVGQGIALIVERV